MKFLMLGGAGAMDMVTARDLAEMPRLSEIILGNVDVKKAEIVAKCIGSKKVSVKPKIMFKELSRIGVNINETIPGRRKL